jgi:DNA-binding response OmpR family regulator
MEKNDNNENTLLVVDDEALNLNILLTYLQSLNYNVVTAEDGKECLAIVKQIKPALILLDVMMPEMDGFETCRRLQANNETREIPIIFMTALTNTEDKVKALEAGAVDYITKPIQIQEVSARINVHLSLRHLQSILKQQKAAIEQKNSELQEKNQEIEAWSKIVLRDLKKPMVRQSSFVSMLIKELAEFSNQEPMKFVREIQESTLQMTDIINDILLLTNVHSQEIVMEVPNMTSIIAQKRRQLTSIIDKYQGKIEVATNLPTVWAYPPWIEKVWEVYLTNALKHGGRPPIIKLGYNPEGENYIRFWVEDNGIVLSEAEKAQLFLPINEVSKLKITKEGYGLKLSIVRVLIEKCGGKVGVESNAGKGNRFYFTLPKL